MWQMFIDLKGLPLIHSYDSIQELNRKIEKHERGHDLVVSVSYIYFFVELLQINKSFLFNLFLVGDLNVSTFIEYTVFFQPTVLCTWRDSFFE